MRIIASKTLPHGENGPPAGTSTGRPRTAPRRGSRPLTNGRGPRLGISRLASARASTPAACLPLTGGRGTATCQRPRRLGLSPVARLLAQGEVGGAGRTDFVQARGGYQHRSGEATTPSVASQESRLAPPLVLPSVRRRRRRQLEADPRGSCQDGTPSPRSRRYRHHHRRHRPHQGTLPQAPTSAWISLGASPVLGARGSFSSHFSFLSPMWTFAFPRTLAACHDRPRPPSLEASRIERRSIPAQTWTSLKKDRRKSRIEVVSRKNTYQVN